MRILITGAGGLVGSHLIPLLEKNHELFTISNKTNNASNYKIDFSKDWSTNILPKGIDAIIHLAQSEDFRDFPEKAAPVFFTNTVSTLKLIDYAVKTGVKNFIYASSAGIYGNSEKPFIESNDIVYKNEMGFYLGTKHCCEVILSNYSSLIDIQMLRLFFVYGKAQRKDMLMPRLISNIKDAKPISLAGQDGIKINPLHASDAAKAIIASLKLNGSHIINVGGSEALSFRQICETIGKHVNTLPNLVIEDKIPNHLIGNISLMEELLVKPTMKFSEGIKTLL